MVFIPSLGAFIAPDLLGGGRKLMIGSLIQLQFSSSRNWPFGAAAALVLLMCVLLLPAFMAPSRRRNPMTASAPASARVPGFAAWTWLFYAFLYAPLVILIIFSFNGARSSTVWSHFSLQWYARAFGNESIQQAAANSIVVAAGATVASTALALLAALALTRGRRFAGAGAFHTLLLSPLMIPEIVTAVATLAFFSAVGIRLGLLNVLIAHIVFCIPFCLFADMVALVGNGRKLGMRRSRFVRVSAPRFFSRYSAACRAGRRRGGDAGVHHFAGRFRHHADGGGRRGDDSAGVHLRNGAHGLVPRN